jgi:hypothetical protein
MRSHTVLDSPLGPLTVAADRGPISGLDTHRRRPRTASAHAIRARS